MRTLDFADSDDPIPSRPIAPPWLIARYLSGASFDIIAETTAQIADQQSKRRRASQRWHAKLERDWGVVVDAISGAYVYSDERRAPVPRRQPMHVAKRRPSPLERCTRCIGVAVRGKKLCANHLEWDRLRRASDAGRERNRESQRASRARKAA